jgi:hypothetical protein
VTKEPIIADPVSREGWKRGQETFILMNGRRQAENTEFMVNVPEIRVQLRIIPILVPII